jgi:hypothetical protein
MPADQGEIMRRMMKALAAATFATGAMAALTVAAPAAQAAGTTATKATGGTYQGCPYGAVCIYPRDKGWNNGRPSNIYWSYGVHKLSNQIGNHVVFNNQYGGAKAYLCKTYSGTNCVWYFPQYTANNYGMTPINSIVLTR